VHTYSQNAAPDLLGTGDYGCSAARGTVVRTANPLNETDRMPKNLKKMANTLSLVAFTFMSFVSVVVFFIEDELSSGDYLVMVGAPFALGALAYFVGRHHDPNACD